MAAASGIATGAGSTLSNSAATGQGGGATSVVSSGNTGKCQVSLTNVLGPSLVTCLTGDSGSAGGAALGGSSGSSIVLAKPPDGTATADVTNSAGTGPGGGAGTRVDSGNTGSCNITMINVKARVTVICITGRSGSARGLAAGGASGSAAVLAGASSGTGGTRWRRPTWPTPGLVARQTRS